MRVIRTIRSLSYRGAAVLVLMLGGIVPLAAQDLVGLKLRQIAPEVAYPWGVEAIGDGQLLVTSKTGGLWQVDLASGKAAKIANTPDFRAYRQGGMLDVAAEAENGKVTVYLCYSKPLRGGSLTVAISKGVLGDGAIEGLREIFVANHQSPSGVHFGCRLVLTEAHLFASLGERGARDKAQDPTSHAGSVVRLHKDGRAAGGNTPAGWAPEVFSKGHRNPQGMARHPETGAIWLHEHGPQGGDEINIVRPGGNYGWPVVSHGQEYGGGSIGKGSSLAGYDSPVWVWVPSIAPSGMAFYQGAMFGEFRGKLLVGALKFKSLYAVTLQSGKPVSETVHLKGRLGRIRDVAVLEDGSLIVLSDVAQNAIQHLTR